MSGWNFVWCVSWVDHGNLEGLDGHKTNVQKCFLNKCIYIMYKSQKPLQTSTPKLCQPDIATPFPFSSANLSSHRIHSLLHPSQLNGTVSSPCDVCGRSSSFPTPAASPHSQQPLRPSEPQRPLEPPTNSQPELLPNPGPWRGLSLEFWFLWRSAGWLQTWCRCL